MILRLLGALVLVYALGFVLFMLALGAPLDGRRTDAIVVPTGAAGRIDRGLELLEVGAARRMLVSGVDPDVRPIELALEYHARPALFECCIDLGQEAVDTRSNGDETARWVARHGYRTIRLVTSDWHMPRARMELLNALDSDVEVLSDPVPTNPPFRVLLREYHKLLVRRIALWLGLGA